MDSAEEIFQTLIAPIERRMIAAVARIVHNPDDAADVFQECLGEIWRKLKKIHRHPNPHAYIMRICVGRSYDALRKRARLRNREISLDESDPKNTVFKARAPERNPEKQAAIFQAIASLSPSQAHAVLLRTMEEMSFADIGASLGCSESTARSHLSKGRARLREILSSLDIL
jgi:RNA polymerase sigma factor (sigma-70 family)